MQTGRSKVAPVPLESRVAEARRVLVKIGSSLLVDPAGNELRQEWLQSLCADVARLRNRGQDVLIVSSGAVALGLQQLGLQRASRLEDKQAAAAAGQIQLAAAYKAALEAHAMPVAQILLTLEDTENRRRYLNARSTLSTLLALGTIPVINENDTVATAEIRYGDNDRLAARVAQMISADCLVLLSDIDGLYSSDPNLNPDARHIPEVTEISGEILAMAGASRSEVGTGGMASKLEAARITLAAGCATVIGDGRIEHPLAALEQGARCSWFLPTRSPLATRKQWIAGSLQPRGTVIIDQGALAALEKGNSLLPAGVVAVEGDFERGDAVRIKSVDGRELARGLAAYSTQDADKIKGRRSGDIENVLGYRGRDELVHRDDLVMSNG